MIVASSALSLLNRNLIDDFEEECAKRSYLLSERGAAPSERA